LGLCGILLPGTSLACMRKSPKSESIDDFTISRPEKFHKTIFNASPDLPLCDFFGLCAMLSPHRVAPAQCHLLGVRCCGLRRSFPPVFTKTISNAPSQFPPSVTSVASVRCFPLSAAAPAQCRVLESSVTGAKAFLPTRVHQNNFRRPIPISPLCDLCDLCAMLSSLRVVLARKPRCPPNSFPATFFLTKAWEKVPQSLVHSQSTILGGHKASLLSHRGLNVLKRIGGTGQEAGIIKR
jgi:hypothetical protein